ncbi:MAG: diguanylate cyclase [Candidatus Sulfotelmatobacter sp.]|nr:diguanylate cyclase [Candidatus Sulfotelmatobacter sp.]
MEAEGSETFVSFESDLAQLEARFSSDEGGHLTPELSADLALEVVLNEIVEQACLATRATGAAIILERDGEMVCRASSGVNAPELGARLGSESGLTAECIKTRLAQRCDDAQSDPRADIEASRNLGVRSVFILPLLRDDELVGVFEVFSSNAAAFGERDERTLEALAHRMLKILNRVADPVQAAVEMPLAGPAHIEEAYLEAAHTSNPIDDPEEAAGNSSGESDFAAKNSLDQELLEAASQIASSRRSIDVFTWILAAAVLGITAWLSVVLGGWLLGRPVVARSRPAVRVSRQTATTEVRSGAIRNSSTDASPAPASGAQSGAAQSSSASAAPAHPAGGAEAPGVNQTAKPAPPAGSLTVYERGKEIFSLPPNAEQGRVTTAATRGGTAGGSQVVDKPEKPIVQPAAIYELSPELAEGSLVYRVEPEYPEDALKQGIQGPVVLEVRAASDGAIQGVKLLSGERLLADAAIAAVKQWRFKPHVVNGRPVGMQTRITLNFRVPR